MKHLKPYKTKLQDKSFTCYADFSSASQVQVWEAVRVQGVDLRTMGVGLHPATLLGDDREE